MTSDEPESDRHVELEVLEPLSLDEALGIIGEETRAGILVALGDARTTRPDSSGTLTFSELMERVGVRDSGRFNYHLDRLVGTFVRKEADGYALRLPGRRLYEAIVAGTLTERRRVDPFPVGACPDCGSRLTAAYHPDHLLTVECTGCETLYDAIHFPARGLEDRSETELLEAAYQRRHHKIGTMRRGVCESCGGVVERSLRSAAAIGYGSSSVAEMAGLEMYAVLSCTGCNASLVGHPANVVLTAPAVAGFLGSHGRDPARSKWWNDPVKSAREDTEILDEDPPAVRVPFGIRGELLAVEVDDSLQVTATTGPTR